MTVCESWCCSGRRWPSLILLMPEDGSGILSDSLAVLCHILSLMFGVLCTSLLILGVHCKFLCVFEPKISVAYLLD